MSINRREFLTRASLGMVASTAVPALYSAEKTSEFPFYKPGVYTKLDSQSRRFHLSVTINEILYKGLQENNCPMPPNPDAIKTNATNMADLYKEAGITDVWLDVYFYGQFAERSLVEAAATRMAERGIQPHMLSVPIGHPGAKFSPEVIKRRQPYEHFSGATDWGVSVHKGVAEDCIQSARQLADMYGPGEYFLDDDYRFAIQPDGIGGCVCPECKSDFMRKSGFSDARWDALIADLRANNDTKDVRTWIGYFCDRMTKLFRDIQAAAPELDLGVMIMGMGSEKAGIRLDDYRGALIRVGEWMFTNAQYGNIKNKTIELYSSLLHRRFVSPGRAFSETTIIQELSAENYVSKLSVSTLSEVRNTMFMCPIPASYWGLIIPRMKREAEYHSHILGAKAKGPFKHFWGLADRYMAGYNAYSLFLGLGVPFEVCDELSDEGWTFLGDASAKEMERGELESNGTCCVARINSNSGRFTQVPETFEELFKFRKTLLPELQKSGVPYVEEETPVVMSWYPDRGIVYLWNIEPEKKVVTVRQGDKTVNVTLKALDSAMIKQDGESFKVW